MPARGKRIAGAGGKLDTRPEHGRAPGGGRRGHGRRQHCGDACLDQQSVRFDQNHGGNQVGVSMVQG